MKTNFGTRKVIALHCALASALLLQPASASTIELSDAFNYNAFIFNNFDGERSDVEGKLAVGGDLTVEHFDVGLLLEPDLSSSALYVGGDLTFNHGQVHGGQVTVSGMIAAENASFDGALISGGSSSLKYGNVESGGIFSQDDVSLAYAGINKGDIEAEGSVDISFAGLGDGQVTYGNELTVTSGNTGRSATKDPLNSVTVQNIDFQALADEVTSQSNAFANMAVNGQTTLRCGAVDCTDASTETIDTIVFSGNEDVNVFSIDSDWFSADGKGIVFDFSTTSYNIINVYGKEVELFNTGFFNTALTEENEYFRENGQYRDNDNNINQRHDGRYTNNILFNFVDADSLSLHSVGVKGSVLAPYAELSFYNGHVDGNVIASSLVTPEVTLFDNQGLPYLAPTGQINDYRFGAIDVSEPASLALLFGTGVFVFARRRKQLELTRK